MERGSRGTHDMRLEGDYGTIGFLAGAMWACMENQMEMQMDHPMEAAVYIGVVLLTCE